MPPDRCPLSIFCSRGTQMDENALSQPTLSLSTRHTVYQESVSWYMTSIPQVMRPFCDRKGGGGVGPPIGRRVKTNSNVPFLGENKTHKTVKARLWPERSGKGP